MKKKALSFVATFGLLATLTVASVSAQPTRLMIVAIPFDFTIGKKTLQAGQYEVFRDGIAGSLIVRGKDNNEAMVFSANSVQAKKTPERGYLVFHRYGNQYFLRQFWMPGNDTGRELSPSQLECRLINERHLAQNAAKPETVYIAIQ